MQIVTTAPPRLYRIDALINEGFSRWEIESYRRLRLLPPPVGRGGGSYYTDIHLSCLRRIKDAKDQNRTMDDIRDMLDLETEMAA